MLIAPGSATKPVGQTQQFRLDAQYQDCYGGICWYNRTNYPSTVWQSNNPGVATVSSTSPTKGLATAVSGGSAGIYAYYYERKYECQSWIGQCVDMGYDVMAAGSATFYVPTPSISLSPSSIQPDALTTVIVQSSPPYVGLQVTLQREEIQYTGGHNHLNRPLGSLGASSGTTNAQGRFQTTYRASLFGGQEKTKATMSAKTVSATLDVQISGLLQLADGADFNLVGSTASHVLPNNHYGTSGANSDLIAIARDYAQLYNGST